MESSKKRKVWGQEKFEEILKDISENNLTTSSAARKYGVPRSTVRDKVLGISSLDARVGRPLTLSQEEENSLVFYIKYRVERGFPVTKKAVLSLAQAIHVLHCEENEEDPKINLQNGLSQNWWRGFKERNDLTTRKPDPLDRGRRDAVDESVVHEFYDLLTETMTKNALEKQPHRIYNVDETGFTLDMQRKKVVTFSKMKAPATSVRKGTREHITTMECVAADGSTIPPLIIFSKSFPSSAYSLEGPDNALYATTPSGFIEADVFLQWLEKCFARFCSPEKPVLLLMDQHSTHVTREAIDLAIKEDIILMGLPPHSSHFLQPLDAPGGPFMSMKSSYEDIVNNLTLAKPNFYVSKSVFSRIYKVVREKTMTMTTIKTGFKKTGIYPVDKDAVDDRWLNMNESTACTKEEDVDMVIDTEKAAEDQLLPEEMEVLRMAETISGAGMQAEREEEENTGRVLLDIEVEMLELAEKVSKRNPPVEKKPSKTSTFPTCRTCGSRTTSTNPFVQAGVVPAYVGDLLTPIPDSQKRKARKVRPKALVFDQEYIDTLEREAKEKEDQKCEDRLRKKEEREEKKRKKMEELENKRKERLEATRKRREEKQRKKSEELEMKRKERMEIRQKRKEEVLSKKKAGTKKKRVSAQTPSGSEVEPRPRRKVTRPCWMAGFAAESEEED